MTSTAICYFSGTGNSLDIANKLASALDGALFFLSRTQAGDLAAHERIVVVTPVYSFGLPAPTKGFLQSLAAYSGKELHVVLHYGGFSGNAAHYTKTFIEKQGLFASGIYKMKMPENYTIVSTVPPFYIKSQLKKSGKAIERIARHIKDKRGGKARKNIFAFCDAVHEKNARLWPDMPKGFIVTDGCTHCGHCQSICPANNITVAGGKPEFLGKCVSCLACYHRCPAQAINYGEKTIGRARYQNPNVDLAKMK